MPLHQKNIYNNAVNNFQPIQHPNNVSAPSMQNYQVPGLDLANNNELKQNVANAIVNWIASNHGANKAYTLAFNEMALSLSSDFVEFGEVLTYICNRFALENLRGNSNFNEMLKTNIRFGLAERVYWGFLRYAGAMNFQFNDQNEYNQMLQQSQQYEQNVSAINEAVMRQQQQRQMQNNQVMGGFNSMNNMQQAPISGLTGANAAFMTGGITVNPQQANGFESVPGLVVGNPNQAKKVPQNMNNQNPYQSESQIGKVPFEQLTESEQREVNNVRGFYKISKDIKIEPKFRPYMTDLMGEEVLNPNSHQVKQKTDMEIFIEEAAKAKAAKDAEAKRQAAGMRNPVVDQKTAEQFHAEGQKILQEATAQAFELPMFNGEVPEKKATPGIVARKKPAPEMRPTLAPEFPLSEAPVFEPEKAATLTHGLTQQQNEDEYAKFLGEEPEVTDVVAKEETQPDTVVLTKPEPPKRVSLSKVFAKMHADADVQNNGRNFMPRKKFVTIQVKSRLKAVSAPEEGLPLYNSNKQFIVAETDEDGKNEEFEIHELKGEDLERAEHQIFQTVQLRQKERLRIDSGPEAAFRDLTRHVESLVTSEDDESPGKGVALKGSSFLEEIDSEDIPSIAQLRSNFTQVMVGEIASDEDVSAVTAFYNDCGELWINDAAIGHLMTLKNAKTFVQLGKALTELKAIVSGNPASLTSAIAFDSYIGNKAYVYLQQYASRHDINLTFGSSSLTTLVAQENYHTWLNEGFNQNSAIKNLNESITQWEAEILEKIMSIAKIDSIYHETKQGGIIKKSLDKNQVHLLKSAGNKKLYYRIRFGEMTAYTLLNYTMDEIGLTGIENFDGAFLFDAVTPEIAAFAASVMGSTVNKEIQLFDNTKYKPGEYVVADTIIIETIDGYGFRLYRTALGSGHTLIHRIY